MPSDVSLHLVGVWFCVGFFTAVGWTLGAWLVGQLASGLFKEGTVSKNFAMNRQRLLGASAFSVDAALKSDGRAIVTEAPDGSMPMRLKVRKANGTVETYVIWGKDKSVEEDRLSSSKHFLVFAAGLLKAKGALPGAVIHAAFRAQGNTIDDHEQFSEELKADERFTRTEDGLWDLKQ